MRTDSRILLSGAVLVLSLSLDLARGQEPQTIRLPPPQTQGGKPLMEALNQRRTVREFKPGRLPEQVLANLLWAGFGINRPENGHRTAPSAMNSQEIDLCVALPEGIYRYDAKANELQPLAKMDVRAKTNGQPFATNAAAVLFFVADLSRLSKAKPESRPAYAHFDAGCICQNIYLFCASQGLAAVVYDLDRNPVAAAMSLKPEQRVIFAQAIGFPADNALPK